MLKLKPISWLLSVSCSAFLTACEAKNDQKLEQLKNHARECDVKNELYSKAVRIVEDSIATTTKTADELDSAPLARKEALRALAYEQLANTKELAEKMRVAGRDATECLESLQKEAQGAQ